MKKFILCTGLLLFFNCSPKNTQTDINDFFSDFSRAEISGIDRYLSKRTLALTNDKKGSLYKNLLFFLDDFKSAEWEILNRKIEEKTAVVNIIYRSHPVENRRGFNTDFFLIREDGAWKLDFFHDYIIKNPAENKKRISEYIKTKRKGY